MEWLWSALFGWLAFLWAGAAVVSIRGMARLPRIRTIEPLADADCPRVSVLFAARDEEEKLPQALPTHLAQDYPNLEIVAVDDRSVDETPRILDEAAARDARLTVVHLRELPKGWLGKTHALTKAYEKSSGEWLVFTDADVRFAPDLLRRTLALARQEELDHLTLLGELDLEGPFEKAVVSFFIMGFMLNAQPWQAKNPRARQYTGVGAFQLIRRSAYEAIGTHRRMALEVVDDMKLGKLVKQGGFRSGVGLAEGSVRVRWQAGVRNVIKGLTKNFFAALDFSLLRAALVLAMLFLLSVLPFAGLFFLDGAALALDGLAVAFALATHMNAARGIRLSPVYALAHPFAALVVLYINMRSVVVTLGRGGVVWRDTFYPLEELRKGLV